MYNVLDYSTTEGPSHGFQSFATANNAAETILSINFNYR